MANIDYTPKFAATLSRTNKGLAFGKAIGRNNSKL